MLFATIAVALAVQAPAHNTENGPSQRSVSWAGEISLVQTRALKTHLSVAEYESKIEDKYLCTWLATGCPNMGLAPNGGNVWPTMADATVWNKMHIFCSLTSSGTANNEQRAFCCGGDNPDCNGLGTCVKQTQWTETCDAPGSGDATTTTGTTTNKPIPTGEPLPTSPDPRFRWEKYEGHWLGNSASGPPGGDSKGRELVEAQEKCIEIGPEDCGGITCIK